MLCISPLPFPRSRHDKTFLLSFLSSVLEQFFSINNCMPTWEGNQCDWGFRYPSWQLQAGIINYAYRIPKRETEICIRVLNFLIHTPNGSYDRALKNLCLSFHFCCSLSMAVHCTDCVLELSNSSPQVFLQFYKGLLYVNYILGHLCYILLLQLEARW